MILLSSPTRVTPGPGIPPWLYPTKLPLIFFQSNHMRAGLRLLSTLKENVRMPLCNGIGPSPIMKYTPQSKRTGLLALKKGMTTLWDEFGKMMAVTVLKVSECEVVRTRFHSGSGKWMCEVGAISQRRLHLVNKPLLFHYRKYRVSPKKKLTEFQVYSSAMLHNLPSTITRFWSILTKGFAWCPYSFGSSTQSNTFCSWPIHRRPRDNHRKRLSRCDEAP